MTRQRRSERLAEGGPAAAHRRGRPGPKRTLTREGVLSAALELLDREGIEAVSMRRVAAALGVQAMALYRYVENKDELVKGIVDQTLGSVGHAGDASGDWADQLSAAMREIYGIFREHPGLVEIIAAQSISSPGLDRLRNRMLAIFRQAGFPRLVGIDMLTTAYSFTIGFALVTRVRIRGAASESARLGALSVEEFPALVDASTDYAHRVSPQAFEFGLDKVIAGLRTVESSSR